jgi:SAM-dependent methyltransferase
VSLEVTGAAYVAAMNRDPTDREYRRAFQDLALTLVPSRGHVFDFGSGPGLDARRYAREGLRVSAYDVNASMCDYFAAHCAREMATGSVQLATGTFEDFLGKPETADADLIVSNFAPLNLVADLPPLMAKFARMLSPGGKLLVSVLNPCFHELPRSIAWWRSLPRLAWSGRYTKLLHGEIPVHRWLPGRLAAEAAPQFRLAAIHAPDTSGESRPLRCVRFTSMRDWPRIVSTQFLFLELHWTPRR